jgi:hypothetical protein
LQSVSIFAPMPLIFVRSSGKPSRAAWNADEIAWVDDNLEGFKGRVTRDNWVAQAKALTGIQVPAFMRRKV